MPLNDQQLEAVNCPLADSALVMAGAGSGKTTVIAQRALRLVSTIPSDKTLQMLTFSNKAAKEMGDRVKSISAGVNISQIRFDTFHSFGMKLIKADPTGFGLTDGFSLFSDSDIKRSVRQLAKSLGLPKDLSPEDKKRLNPMAWMNTWSLAKQAGYNVNNPDNKNALRERLVNAHGLSATELLMVENTLFGYEADKQRSNIVDFDDLLFLPLLRIARNDQYRSSIQSSLGYVICDEAQDTNRIQYELVKRICSGCCGATFVGDDDQSIYGWRGAEVSNFKRFLRDFSALEFRLEENYRSTQAIVETAGNLIKNNTERLIKNPFSSGVVGEAPELVCSADSREMADAISANIKRLIDAGTAPRDIAVLYRTNRMALLVEGSLKRRGIDYHVVGGMSLFDRAEVMAVSCALRVAKNGKDIHALKGLSSYIDGFGDSSFYVLSDAMELDASINLHNDDLAERVPELKKRACGSLAGFLDDLRGEVMFCTSAESFVRWCIEGPMALLEREKDDQLRASRAQNLESLATDIQLEVEERQLIEPGICWADVLMEVALRDARQSDAKGQQVTLSTLHRSKGLEWPHVMLAGMSEGLIPLTARGVEDDEEANFVHVEEERRLGYVGLTRAKTTCTFYHADFYHFPGNSDSKQYSPSRFLAEMGVPIPDMNPTASINETHDGEGDQFMSSLNNLLGRGQMRMN